MAAKLYKNLIGGEWVDSRSGKSFENQNPANTKDVVGIFPRSNRDDVNEAVEAAKQAFERWRLTPAPRRGEIIFRCAQILAERKEDCARDMTREMGKVLKETRGDVQEAIDTAFYMAGEGRRLDGRTVPSELPNKFAMAMRVPLGVVGMITPWNFPMAIPSWKIFPAIVCGNTCVIKPAEDTPLSTVNLVRALIDGGSVETMFMDHAVQQLLRQYAATIDEDCTRLDDIFESDKRRHDVLIHHARGHTQRGGCA